jgi:hypothetical protein
LWRPVPVWPGQTSDASIKGTPVAYTLALLAAFAFGLGAVLQQKGTLESPAGENDPRFLV